MQRYLPHFKKIVPNDFLLNMTNHHLNQALACHSKILTFRMDFDYQRGTSRFIHNSPFEIQDDLQELTQAVMQVPPLCGCFWVLEWAETNAIHVHVILYLKGQRHQKSFPFIQQIGDLWLKVINDEGKYERCKPEGCYRDNINNVVDYYDDEDVKSLRHIASYPTKESQESGYLIWRCNEVPEPAKQGRPGKTK